MATMTEQTKETMKRRAQAAQDSLVIKRCQEGDLAAFEELVRRYWSTAVGVSMLYLHNREDAVDCSQDAFVRALETLPRFDNTRPFFPWFYGLLKHSCLKKLRRMRIRGEVPLEKAGDLPSPGPDPRADGRPALRQALDHLSAEHREILLLRHWQDMSYEDISTATGLPVGTVMSRLHYARRELKELLRDL
jgi:RNA polymerase sigma-70 factor (ECF subfamily)